MIPKPTFWQRHQRGGLGPADLPNLPRELNPYERFFVRWLFAEAKLLLFVPVGVFFGITVSWLSHGRLFP